MAGKILVVDPVPTHRIILRSILEAAQYSVRVLSSISDATAEIDGNRPDLIVLSEPEQGLALVIASLGSGKDTCDAIPILCLDCSAQPLDRLEALRAGAREFLPRKLPEQLFLAQVRRLLRESESLKELRRRRLTAAGFGFAEQNTPFSGPKRVAIVARPGTKSDRLWIRGHQKALNVQLQSPAQVLEDCQAASVPDVYVLILDREHPGTILRLVPELRARAHSRHAALFVICPAEDFESARNALDMGATDIMPDDACVDEFTFRLDAVFAQKAQSDALRHSTEETYRLAVTDVLTGLYNRRYADAYLAEISESAAQTESNFALMIIDIDHFKRVNDTYGHLVGDDVLRRVSHRIRENLRGADLVSRHGGEEFLVIMPDTDGVRARQAADRLRDLVCASPVQTKDGTTVNVTVSIGVSVSTPTSTNKCADANLELLDRADRALYRAKEQGRNRIDINLNAA